MQIISNTRQTEQKKVEYLNMHSSAFINKYNRNMNRNQIRNTNMQKIHTNINSLCINVQPFNQKAYLQFTSKIALNKTKY